MDQNYYSYHVTTNGEVFNKFGGIIKSYDNGRGYLIVNINTDKRRVCKAIHRLVAEVYLPNPYHLSDVDHIDGNKLNNNLDNLRWLSHGDNIKHSYNSGRRSAKGSMNARSLLVEDEVIDIRFLISIGYRLKCLVSFGYPKGSTLGILSGKNWGDVH